MVMKAVIKPISLARTTDALWSKRQPKKYDFSEEGCFTLEFREVKHAIIHDNQTRDATEWASSREAGCAYDPAHILQPRCSGFSKAKDIKSMTFKILLIIM